MTNHTLHTRLQTSSLPISLSLSSPQGWKCNCTSFLQSLAGNACVCFVFLSSCLQVQLNIMRSSQRKNQKDTWWKLGVLRMLRMSNLISSIVAWNENAFLLENMAIAMTLSFPKVAYCTVAYQILTETCHPNMTALGMLLFLIAMIKMEKKRSLLLIAIVSDRLVNKNGPIRAGNCIIGDISFCLYLDCWYTGK